MPIRERILVMGGPGTGKSFQWLKMAEALKSSKFYVIDTDEAIPFMLETLFPHLKSENGGNVYVRQAYDWPLYEKSFEWAVKSAREQDWIIVDMVDNAWSSAQKYYIGEVFDKDMGHFLLEARKVMPEGAKSLMRFALEGWNDWSVVNKLYDDCILPIIYRTKCHVYMTTKVQEIGKQDSRELKLLFGSLGLRPSGQKNLGHQAHTVLLFSFDGNNVWRVTTAKDRGGRQHFDNVRLINFYQQYLVAKAGWPMP